MDLWQEIKNNLSAEKRRELLKLLSALQNRESTAMHLAIVGISGKYPMAENIDEYWNNLKDGKNCISQVPLERWDWKYFKEKDGKAFLPKWGGFIKDIDKFDPLFFGIAPKEAELMDPQERLFLETIWALLEDAGMTRKSLERLENRVGIFVGAMNCDYMREGGNAVSYWSIANRVSYIFNLQGPSLAVDTACSSSLAAVHLACESLRRGECLAAIAGGVNLIIRPEHYQTLLQAKLLTQGNQTKAFGENADGFVDAEGVGAILIKPLTQAIKDQDTIYALIRGSSMNAGGKTSGYGVPNPNAQKNLIKDALKSARIHPRTLSYLEAQATGSNLGDPIEMSGLTAAFKQFTADKQFCAIGSVKSNIGHLESAAGIAAITKVVLQMKYKQLVPTLHSQPVSSKISLEDSPFYLQYRLSDWEKPIIMENGIKTAYPRRAGVSSFGAGGANVHIILEEYEAKKKVYSHAAGLRKNQIIVLSAKNEERLKEHIRNIADYLEKNKILNINDIAYTLQTGREAMEARFAIVADTCEELQEKLSAYLDCKLAAMEYSCGNVRKDKTRDKSVGADQIQDLIRNGQFFDLAQLWVQGSNIEWNLLYTDSTPNRISLPTYPFLRERFWVAEFRENRVTSDDRKYEEEQPFSDGSKLLTKMAELSMAISQILTIPATHVDPETDLLELGFDTTTLFQFCQYINEHDNVNIMPAVFTEYSTLNSFIPYLNQLTKQNVSAISPQDSKIMGYNDDINQLMESEISVDLMKGISEILGVKLKDIDVDMEMSDFGFNSITLTQFSQWLNEKYNLKVMPSIFFEYSTLAAFIEYLKIKCQDQLIDFYRGYVTGTDIQSENSNREVCKACASGAAQNEQWEVAGNELLKENLTTQGIAIIGLSGVLPLSEDLEAFWRQMEAGKDLISEIPADRWNWRDYYGDPTSEPNKTDIIWGGFMKEIDKFDARFFGMSPREAKLMDPQHRIFLETVWKAVEDSGYKMTDIAGTNTGVFVGVATTDYENLLHERGVEIQPQTATGSAHSMLANRISYLFNLRGPSEPVDTACSSSLVAIHRAIESIRNGDCEMAIAGGVNAIIHPMLHIAFSKSGMLSEDGRCKTFDKRANGYVRSEGCGAVILKPLSKAESDGDHIYAVIRGSAINHGGHANSLTAPNPNAQAELIINAWEKAGLDPSTVSYIETHGSGTSLGDPVEINGLKKAFDYLYKKWNKSVSDVHCGLGTVKTYIGHLETASGIAGIINTLLFMKHQRILPNLHFQELNPYIQLEDSPFYIVDKAQKWHKLQDGQGRDVPRRAGVSSFGFGGVNAHVILEDYDMPAPKRSLDKPQIIILSAKNETLLKNCVEKLRDFLEKKQTSAEMASSISLAEVAFTLQIGRVPMETRLAVVVANMQELIEKLNQFVAGKRQIDGFYYGVAEEKKSFSPGDTILPLIQSGAFLEIAQKFVRGDSIDWTLLYPGEKPGRISLPTYPFERERYWVDSMMNFQNNSPVESNFNNKIALQSLPEYTASFPLNTGQRVTGSKIKLEENKGDKSETQSREEMQDVNEIVKQLQTILAKVLYIETDKIDTSKVFSELGLDSILSLEFTQKINQEFGADLKTARLYDYSTIKELANYLSMLKMKTGETPNDIDSLLEKNRQDNDFPKIKLGSYSENKEDKSETQHRGEMPDVNGIVKQLQNILVKVLYIEVDKIDTNKAFSELGLDSILSLEFTQKINKEFGVDFKTARLYDYSTIKRLASYLSTFEIKINKSQVESFLGTNISHTSQKDEKMAVMFDRPEIVQGKQEARDPNTQEIAVIGMSARFPGANNIYEFWENIKNGVDSVSEVPIERWDVNQYYRPDSHASGKTYCKWGGFLRDIDQFDPLFFNISPADAELLDPQQRLFLMESWKALEDAGYSSESLDNMKCGVYAGVMTGGEYQPSNLFNTPSILAARIAYFLNLKGPAVAVDTACSSSAVAIHLACQSLLKGETDMMLAGGVTFYLTVNPYLSMCKGGMLSRDGRCKAFDNRADGFVPGEGVGVVVLKRLDRAIKDGDIIYGIIKASAMNQDGRTNGITAPSAQSQTELETAVYEMSGIYPESISYVECHGTGTKLGDPIEIDALAESFGRYTQKKQYCPVGSVKTNIGHTSAASGVASLIKVLMALKHKMIPPSIHFQKENEHIHFSETPFYVNQHIQEWQSPESPRRAAMSSFGFSGTNVHMIIEEAPDNTVNKVNAAEIDSSYPYFMIPISAKDETVLLNRLKDLSGWLRSQETATSIGDLAYTLGAGRSHFSCRMAFVVKNIRELELKLNAFSTGQADVHNVIKKGTASVEATAAESEISELIKELQPAKRLSETLFKQKISLLADQYLNGVNLDWSKLYDNWGSHKISLPAYPFLLKRYWSGCSSPTDSIKSVQPIFLDSENIGYDIPIFEIPTKSIWEKQFQIMFSGEEFYLKDNDVYGEKVLSPSVFPEILRVASEMASGKKMKVMMDLVMLKLINTSGGCNLYVNVLLKPEHVNLVISTIKKSKMVINATGKVNFKNAVNSAESQVKQRINIQEIKNRCCNFLGREDFYRICDRTGHISGITLKPIQSIFYNCNEALTFLELDDLLKQRKSWVGLHPSLVQGILTSFTGLIIDEVETIRILSFGIKKIEIFNTLPEKCYAYVKWSDGHNRDSQLLHFDFQVYDLQGDLILEIKDYYLKKIPDVSQTVNVESSSDSWQSLTLPKSHILDELLKDVRKMIAGILKVNAIAIDLHTNLLEYGFTSITIMEFIQAVNEQFNMEAALDDFFDLDSPTLNSLTRHLYGQYQQEINTYYCQRVTGTTILQNDGAVYENLVKDIKKIVANILKVDETDFHTQTALLEYGFTSITIMEFIAAVNNQFHIETTLDHFFDLNNPTLESLTRYLYTEYQCQIDNYYGFIQQIAISKSDESDTCENKWDTDGDAEAPPAAKICVFPAESQQIIVLSARDKKSLKEHVARMIAFLNGDWELRPEMRHPQEFTEIRKKFKADIIKIAGEILKVTADGYVPAAMDEFIGILNQRFGISVAPEQLVQSSSLTMFIKYLEKNFKKAILSHYAAIKIHCDCTPADLAYTLQTAAEELEERLVVVVPTFEALLEKLIRYYQDKEPLDNLFEGNACTSNLENSFLTDEEGEEFVAGLIQRGKYSKLARFWVNGGKINWNLLYSDGNTPARVFIPGYPFGKEEESRS